MGKYRTNNHTGCRAHYRIRAVRGKMSQRFVFCSVIINSRCSNVESRSAGSATSLIQFAWPCCACKYYSAQNFYVTSAFMSFDTSYIYAFFVLIGIRCIENVFTVQPLLYILIVSFTYTMLKQLRCWLHHVLLFSECIGK